MESALQKVINIDLQKVSGESAVLIDYDATSCYDRIIPKFAD